MSPKTLIQIDARGKSCPEPVLLTKKALQTSPSGIQVTVDNTTAKENITRFAKNAGYTVDATQNESDFVLTLKK